MSDLLFPELRDLTVQELSDEVGGDFTDIESLLETVEEYDFTSVLTPGDIVGNESLEDRCQNEGILIWTGEEFVEPDREFVPAGVIPDDLLSPTQISVYDHLPAHNTFTWFDVETYREQLIDNIDYDEKFDLVFTSIVILPEHKNPGETICIIPIEISIIKDRNDTQDIFEQFLETSDEFMVESGDGAYDRLDKLTDGNAEEIMSEYEEQYDSIVTWTYHLGTVRSKRPKC